MLHCRNMRNQYQNRPGRLGAAERFEDGAERQHGRDDDEQRDRQL